MVEKNVTKRLNSDFKLLGQEILFSILLGRDQEKKKTEQLADNEARSGAFSDATFEGLVFTGKGKCLARNSTATEMFGYGYEELTGKDSTDVIVCAWHEIAKENIPTGYDQPYDARAKRKDESTFWAEVQGKMFNYQDKRIRGNAMRDISQRKKAEQQLNNYLDQIETLVSERTAELETKNQGLEHANNLFIGREYQIKELKNQPKEKNKKLAPVDLLNKPKKNNG